VGRDWDVERAQFENELRILSTQAEDGRSELISALEKVSAATEEARDLRHALDQAIRESDEKAFKLVEAERELACAKEEQVTTHPGYGIEFACGGEVHVALNHGMEGPCSVESGGNGLENPMVQRDAQGSDLGS
jgi:chromosome segregation ATPase